MLLVARASGHSTGERSNSSNGCLNASVVPVERRAMSASLGNPPLTPRAFRGPAERHRTRSLCADAASADVSSGDCLPPGHRRQQPQCGGHPLLNRLRSRQPNRGHRTRRELEEPGSGLASPCVAATQACRVKVQSGRGRRWLARMCQTFRRDGRTTRGRRSGPIRRPCQQRVSDFVGMDQL